PNGALLPILSPSGFIRLHRGTRADASFDSLQDRLRVADDPVQAFDDLARADLAAGEDEQQGTDLSHRHAHERAHQRNQAGQTYPDASLPHCLLMELNWSLVPAVALRTPPCEEPMVDHLHWLGIWPFNHFSHPCQAHASQAEMALRAGHDAMLHHLGRDPTTSSPMGLGIPLLPRFFLVCRAFLHVLVDELWRLALLFQFLNTSQRQAQHFLHLGEFFSPFVIVCPQALEFFLLIHEFQSIREVKSEHLHCGGQGFFTREGKTLVPNVGMKERSAQTRRKPRESDAQKTKHHTSEQADLSS